MTDTQAADNHHYLARDYNSFRALMLDHLAAHASGLSTDDAASLEVALVEVLAYVADYLSYYQDAVATEAYLATARERVSVRRHARLLDYRLNEGCSARVWVHVETSAERLEVPRGTALITKVAGIDSVLVPAAFETDDREVFETMHDSTMRRAHNRLPLAEGDSPLRPGDTSARLAGALPHLAVGDVLVLQQEQSGWGHAVRLADIVVGDAATDIAWHAEDGLPADLPHDGPWSFLGNMVLADHGRSAGPEWLIMSGRGDEASIACPDLSYAMPYRHAEAIARSAANATLQDPHAAEPNLFLLETIGDRDDALSRGRPTWTGRREILRASSFERSFAVEPIGDGYLKLRFGDGVRGRQLQPDWQYLAYYRTGRGARGNIGPHALAHIALDDDRIIGVTNPIAATGGADPETLAQAREAAPAASEVQRRCVTEADYEQAVGGFPGVASVSVKRGAAAEGSVISIHVGRHRHRPVEDGFKARLRDYLVPLQLIGDELRIVGAHHVRPVVAIEIAVERGRTAEPVVEEVRRRLLEDVALGFGETLDAARLTACARSVEGVAAARLTVLARAGAAGTARLAAIRPGAMEIVRIDPTHLTVTAEARR